MREFSDQPIAGYNKECNSIGKLGKVLKVLTQGHGLV